MTFARRFALALAFLLAPTATSPAFAGDQTSALRDAKRIAVAHGINRVPNFDGNGRDGLIVYAWRDNMNAHGHGIYSVLLPRSGTKDDWNLVTFETHTRQPRGGTELDSISDEPFDEEFNVESVWFIRSQSARTSPVTVIVARRDLSKAESIVAAAPVEFSIYRLMANAEGVPGRPNDYFDRIEHFVSKRLFCSSEMAIVRILSQPPPAKYAGPRTNDGCLH